MTTTAQPLILVANPGHTCADLDAAKREAAEIRDKCDVAVHVCRVVWTAERVEPPRKGIA